MFRPDVHILKIYIYSTLDILCTLLVNGEQRCHMATVYGFNFYGAATS